MCIICTQFIISYSFAGYFVRNENGSTKAIWWESEDAHQIDFTNPEAAEWFSSRIAVLKDDPGVDGFKFDAGETDYAIPVVILILQYSTGLTMT